MLYVKEISLSKIVYGGKFAENFYQNKMNLQKNTEFV